MSSQTEEPSNDPIPDPEIGMEEPAADVLEQHRTVDDQEELEGQVAQPHPLEADPADVADQRRDVPEDDESRGE
jgi:hypothetical protein